MGEQVLAGAASVIAAILLVPQVWRVESRRDRTGVSLSWACLGIVVNSIWVSYFVRLELWPAVLAPAMAVVAYVILMWRLSARRSSPGLVSVTTGGLLALGTLIGLSPVAGYVLAVAPMIHILPAVVAVFRVANPSGVSMTTWALSGVEAGLWGMYGGLVGEMSLVAYGVVTLFGSVLILARCLATRASSLRAATRPVV